MLPASSARGGSRGWFGRPAGDGRWWRSPPPSPWGRSSSATNPLPRPVRVVAHAIGLPVDSPDLVDARQQVSDLRDAMSAGDRQQVVDRAADLRNRLGTLHRDDRAAIEDEAHDALADADHWLATRAAPPSEHPTEPAGPPHDTPGTSTAPAPSTPSAGGEHETQQPDQHTEPEQPDTTTSAPPPETEDHLTPWITRSSDDEPEDNG